MKLKTYLVKKKLTLKAFGDMADIIPQAVHKYATGIQYPRPETAARIVAATKGQVSLDDIYGASK